MDLPLVGSRQQETGVQQKIVKQVKKKQKHKSKGSIRTITKQVKADSFFNFFDPPIVPDDPNAEVDEDTQVVASRE